MVELTNHATHYDPLPGFSYYNFANSKFERAPPGDVRCNSEAEPLKPSPIHRNEY